jgi:hypothetical protein
MARTLGEVIANVRVERRDKIAADYGLKLLAEEQKRIARDESRNEARYSGITNEGLRITCHELKDITLKFGYVGVSRLSDRHQIECFGTNLQTTHWP